MNNKIVTLTVNRQRLKAHARDTRGLRNIRVHATTNENYLQACADMDKSNQQIKRGEFLSRMAKKYRMDDRVQIHKEWLREISR